MPSYDLGFGKIFLLREDMAEVFINEGVEMSATDVDIYHDFLKSHLRAPFVLLINKIHSYTYSFDAQRKLAALPEIRAMAVITYDESSTRTTHYLASIPREVEWNMKIFPEREPALKWLEFVQEKCVVN